MDDATTRPAAGNADAPGEDRVEEVLAGLTLDEKVAMCAGADRWHATGVPRLGIPGLKHTDGPTGARGEAGRGTTSACFPCGTALGATWDPALLGEIGGALADEARTKGAQVLLGPTINLHRTPLAGRNFECYSEDPWLTGTLATAFVRGVQGRGVAATPKHFVANDQEHERFTISAEVDERTLRELYLRPFETVVRAAGPWVVMAAYNRVNGTYACDHRELLVDVLKHEWGFDGYVVSDWGAVHDTVGAANGGTDLEMPGPPRHFGARLLDAVRRREVAEEVVTDKARRLLRVAARTGGLDAGAASADERSVDRPADRALARRAATEAMVCLKNDGGVLPLRAGGLAELAVIGPNAATAALQGGGSATVRPHREVHPLAALRERLAPGVRVVHEPGCHNHRFLPPVDPARLEPAVGEGEGLTCEYFSDLDLSGAPLASHTARRTSRWWTGAPSPGVDPETFSVRLHGRFRPRVSGAHTFGLRSAGRSRLYVDDALVIDNWTDQDPGEGLLGPTSGERHAPVDLRAGTPVDIRVEYAHEAPGGGPVGGGGLALGLLEPGADDLLERAETAAARADATVVVVGTTAEWETEGSDRASMDLPGRQDELVSRVAAANPRTVVVLNTGSPHHLPWADQVPAVVQAWFGGQEMGEALADVLLGEAEPGGRLPTTFPRRYRDNPTFPAGYPGELGAVRYGEGVFGGHRWYDARDTEVLFPFGHGLGYTTFGYGPVTVAPATGTGGTVEVRVDVTNEGDAAGKEVVQVYVRHLDPPVARPLRELRGAAVVRLAPGETRTVAVPLAGADLAWWHPAERRWVASPGRYEVAVGRSSRDLRGTATLTWPATARDGIA